MLSSQAIESGAVSTTASAPCSARLCRDARALRRRALAGEAQVMRHDRRDRRRRPVGPDRVERVAVERHQLAAGLFGGGAIARDLAERVQPRVVAEHCAGLERRRRSSRPAGCVDQMAELEEPAIDLGRGLQGVAAIDEDRRRSVQNDRQPGRAGEAGQPSQPLRRGGTYSP